MSRNYGKIFGPADLTMDVKNFIAELGERVSIVWNKENNYCCIGAKGVNKLTLRRELKEYLEGKS